MGVMIMPRAKKGSVVIDSRNGMLRLRFPRTLFNGTQKYLSLNLPDNDINRKIAEAKTSQINIDIICNQFDFTLNKYRMITAPEQDTVSLLEIFKQYFEFKSHHLKHSSMKNLISVKNKLLEMPESVLNSPKNVKSWLVEQNSQEQARRSLMQLSSCCDWAIEQELMKENPFKTMKKIKRVYDPNPDPFTVNERNLIIETFEQEKPLFANFVKFLFFTGCRPSEAVALRWENVNLVDHYLIFCESIVEGKLEKTLKTQTQRNFPMNNQLKEIINNQSRDHETVFISERGKAIDVHNFTNRTWTPLLKTLPIRKRGCYHCRHTFITLCLDAGIPIQQVANWVGNSPEIILRHYAGLTRSEVPNL